MTAFAHDMSCEYTKSELDLFSVLPTQTSMEHGSWVECHPLTTVADGSPIEFDVCGSGDDYVDFAKTTLHVKAKVTNENGTDLAADAAVGPVNLFLHSLFSQVEISLNGTLITSSTNTYPYRAMIETLLSYGMDPKTSQLTSALYYKNTAGNMDSVDFDDEDNVNKGLAARRNMAPVSRVIDMMGRLHADIFFQKRYMLSEVGVKIKLIRSKDTFCLMGDNANYKVKITHASLFARKVKVMPSVFLAYAMERNTAKYPIRRVVCKSFTIPQNYLDMNHEKLFSGQLPTCIVIGLVDNRSFNGSRDRNPFNFANFNLNEIGQYLDGQEQNVLRPIQPNFATGEYIRAYNTIFAGTANWAPTKVCLSLAMNTQTDTACTHSI